MKKKNREGTITDIVNGKTKEVKWVGHWSTGETKGVTIPLKLLPKMNIEVDRVYRIQFDYVDNRHNHHVDSFVIFDGIDGIEDPFDRRKSCRYARFRSIDNLKVLMLLKDERKDTQKILKKVIRCLQEKQQCESMQWCILNEKV